MTEREAMRRALALAWRGWGRVHPNPMVGCVLLRDGEKIAEGYHAEFGGQHAEVEALRASSYAKGATMVVTLEPCNHAGKTPPCTEAIIAAGVRRVVYAVADPDAEAKGGAARLGAAGVDVEGGLLAADAAAQNASFLWSEMRPDRPFVALKVATSLDGFVADGEDRSRWISSKAALDWVHWLRAGFDAIAVGRLTAEADDPQLTVRGAIEPRLPPTRVILSRGAMLNPDLQVVRTAREVPTLFVTGPDIVGVVEQRLRGTGVEVVAASDLRAGLVALRARGLRSILVEGGGRVASALLSADLVDRVYWVQAPLFLAGGRSAFGDRAGVRLHEARRWIVTERRALGDDTLLVVDLKLCSPAS
jgi:diaminohydroxyphosphoribosylaminopyrimidine deaminase/5-amino-6-(5-phosphoribosylamino)uracil reductase